MIRYIIIEDEPAALRRLHRQLCQIRPDWSLTNTADSVNSGIKVVEEKNFDLIFCDIELSDGNCFDIFRQTGLTYPVIFITAYDEYAVKAFDFNSIHYLLKPIHIHKLQGAIEKFERNKLELKNAGELFKDSSKNQLKDKILTKIGNKTRVINIPDVICFYYSNRISKCVLKDGKEYYLDKSLNQIMEYLPEPFFFRINRQVIISKNYVKSYISVSSNRLQLKIDPPSPFPFIVSKERASDFRQWVRE